MFIELSVLAKWVITEQLMCVLLQECLVFTDLCAIRK